MSKRIVCMVLGAVMTGFMYAQPSVEEKPAEPSSEGVSETTAVETLIPIAYRGVWINESQKDGVFQVFLNNNGSVTLEAPTREVQPIGEWMVINEKALIVYFSGWRQFIARDEKGEGFVLSSYQPGQRVNTAPVMSFPIERVQDLQKPQVVTRPTWSFSEGKDKDIE